MSAPEATSIDPGAIRIYCDVVFGYLTGRVPVRLFAETGTPHQTPTLEYPDTGGVAERLIALAPGAAKARRGVYVVPGTVQAPGEARAADVRQTGVILVDLDTGDIAAKRDHLVRHLGDASLEVASGGLTTDGQTKLHLIWRLTEAATLDDLATVVEIRRRIAEKVGGDPAFGSLHQPIRVAGTIHGKNGKRAAVRLLASRSTEYELHELADAVDVMAPMPGLPSGAHRPGGLRPKDLATRIVAAGGQDGENRFAALSSVIGHWLRNVRTGRVDLGEAWSAVREHNAAMIRPPWDETLLRREFDALRAKDEAREGAMPGRAASEPAADTIAPMLSDDALADDFVARHGTNWRHVPAWGVWFRWTGAVWLRDETRLVRELVRRICRISARQASGPAEAQRIASEKKMAAVLRIVAADPRVALPPSSWDAHPMLLNTPEGVVDLATGEIRPHDPDLLITQMTTASPGSGCPRWTRFLHEVTDGDRELQAYLARLAGYCLTGSTGEQTFAFLHGSGANGKSVFLQTLATIMGSYAATAALDTFMASRADRHLTELAGLRAARLVLVSETDAGRSWAEGRIKAITGGENVRANFMRQDHFEFTPQFKILVAGNHLPSLTGTGEAMRRRLHLVPFTVTIPAGDRDPHLGEKLLAERDGILGWMLAGCLEWNRQGLSAPACVAAAADEYFDAQDLVGQWIAECCACGPEHRAPAAQLFRSWKEWAEDGGFPPGSQKSLGEALRGRGFTPTSVRRSRGWLGILVRSGPLSEEAS